MAKQLWFTDDPASTHNGNNDAKLNAVASWWVPYKIQEVRGSSASAVLAAVSTVTGPTPGIEVQASSPALPIEWWSEPLSADFTISGTITLNLWGYETNMSANAAINAVIQKVDGATGALTTILTTARVTELAITTGAVNNFTGTPTSTACKRGDRLRIRVFLDDAGTMAATHSGAFEYDRSTASVNGDSWIQFTENLTFEPPGDPAYMGGGSSDGATVALGSSAGNSMVAQSFIASSDLGQVRATVSRSPTAPSDNLIVEIQTDNAGDPSGTVVATVATVNGSSLTTTATEYSWLCNISLTPAVQYWVVFRRSGAVSAAQWFNLFDGSVATSGWTPAEIYSGVWTPKSVPYPYLRLSLFGLSTTYYLTNTIETEISSAADERKALTTRGSSAVVQSGTLTTNGPTAGIQTSQYQPGGPVTEWYTPPLEAFTLGGKAKFNIRASESNAAANASLKAEIAVVAGDGTGAVVWGAANIESDASGGELGTAESVEVAWVAGDDVAVTAGKRLRFRFYVDDTAIGPLVAGYQVTIWDNGPTAGASGDTYVILPVAVTESGPQTRYGVVALPITVGKAVAASKQTFAQVDRPYTFAKAVAGVRKAFGVVARPIIFGKSVIGPSEPAKFVNANALDYWSGGEVAQSLTNFISTAGLDYWAAEDSAPVIVGQQPPPPVTYFGATSLAITFGKATAGQRTAFSTVALPITFTKAVAAQRTTKGVVALPLIFTKAVQARRSTFSTIAAPFVFGETTAARRTTFGVVARPIVFSATTAGVRTAFGVVALPVVFGKAVAGLVHPRQLGSTSLSISFGKAVQGVRRTTSTVALPISFTKVVAGRRHTFSAVAAPFTFTKDVSGIATAGAVTHYGVVALPVTFSKAVAGQRKTYSTIAAPFVFSAVVAGQRQAFATVALPISFTKAVVGRRQTFGTVARPITVGITTAGVRIAFNYFGVVSAPFVFGKAVQAQRKTFGTVAVPLVFSKAVAGRKQTFSTISAPFVFAGISQAQRKTFGVVARPISFSAVTQSRKQFARIALPLVFSKDAVARKTTHGTIALPITFVKDVQGIGFTGSQTRFGATAAAFTFGKDVRGRKQTFGTVARPIVFTKAVAGQKKTFGQVARPIIFTKAVQGQKKTFGVVARPIIIAFTTAGVRLALEKFGTVTLPITFGKAVAGQRKTFAVITRPILFSATTQARKRTFTIVALPIVFSKEVQGARGTTSSPISLPIIWSVVTKGVSEIYEPPPTNTLLGATFATAELLSAGTVDGVPMLLGIDEEFTELLSAENGKAELGSAGEDTPVLGGVS